jgi:putative sigma-54 modulation protein
MNITITSDNIEVTDAMRGYALAKLERVRKVFNSVIDLKCHFSVERDAKAKEDKHKVSIKLHTGSNQVQSSTDVTAVKKKGAEIFIEQLHHDMYAALDLLIDRLLIQIDRLKGRIKGQRTVKASAKRLHGDVFGARRFTPA